MIEAMFKDFEESIRERNPILADSLRNGIPREVVREKLQNAGIKGFTDPLEVFFSWRNGASPGQSALNLSPFPESIYGFLDLDTAISQVGLLHECLVYHPRFAEADGRYFPLFWDGSNSWIALDLGCDLHGRVVLLITESEELVHELHASLNEFIHDAIRANLAKEPLACFDLL